MSDELFMEEQEMQWTDKEARYGRHVTSHSGVI